MQFEQFQQQINTRFRQMDKKLESVDKRMEQTEKSAVELKVQISLMREGVNDFRNELREQGDEMVEFMSFIA